MNVIWFGYISYVYSLLYLPHNVCYALLLKSVAVLVLVVEVSVEGEVAFAGQPYLGQTVAALIESSLVVETEEGVGSSVYQLGAAAAAVVLGDPQGFDIHMVVSDIAELGSHKPVVV